MAPYTPSSSATNQGGRMGPTLPNPNSKKNTLANILSKNTVGGGDYQNPGGAAALPPLDPASTANYYSQLGNLYSQFELTRGALKSQRVGIKADARAQMAGVKGAEIQGIQAVQGDALDRGVLGSTGELQSRADVSGQAAAERAGITGQKLRALSENRQQGAQNALGLYQGIAGLESQKLAQQQTLLAQQLERNMIISGQESTIDALAAIYDSLMAQFGPMTKSERRKKLLDQAPSAFTQSYGVSQGYQTGGGF